MAQEPRGIRNNNPGNIRKSATQWEGQSSTQGDDAFVTFETPEHGIRAMARVLQTYREKHGLDTIRKIVSRWAPDIENDTEAYIKSVAAQLGVRPDVPLNPGQTPKLIAAIIKHENGVLPYSNEQIIRGVQMASGEAPGFTDTTREPERRTTVQVADPRAPERMNIQGRRPTAAELADAGDIGAAGGAALAAAAPREGTVAPDAGVEVAVEPLAPNPVVEQPFVPPKPGFGLIGKAFGNSPQEEPGAVSPEPFRCATCGNAEPCLRADCGHPLCTARGPDSDTPVAHVQRPSLAGAERRRKS